jgi:steroid 5-alpha reductase family enzyme
MTIEAILFVLSINLFGFVWCYIKQSDHLTDLIYSLSFIGLVSILFFQENRSLSHYLIYFMVVIWGVRLGIYLVYRVRVMGRDKRFDKLRANWLRIGTFWLLQSLSVLLVSLPLFVVFGKETMSTGNVHILGLCIALIGFLIEVVADHQKFSFRNNSNNQGLFIQKGLWKWVQHPNYTGEILFWCGIFMSCMPSLLQWEWLSILSPLWIIILLLRISGIPILQKSAHKKYGHLASYQTYAAATPKLLPFLY